MINIFRKRFEDVTSEDIQKLFDMQYQESQIVEYKSQMYGRSDSEKKEMLRDISSFANAYGGILIIGIEEQNKVPINKINIENVEQETDRIEMSCLSNIEPRISGLKCKVISMESGENIIIVFIPRSFRKPHMINFKDLNQFWIRHQERKLLMSIEEIREACL